MDHSPLKIWKKCPLQKPQDQIDSFANFENGFIALWEEKSGGIIIYHKLRCQNS